MKRNEGREVLTCGRFVAGLNDYLDDASDAAIRDELDLHVAGCPRCRIIAETTRRTIELYRAFVPCGVPAALEARLMAAIRDKSL